MPSISSEISYEPRRHAATHKKPVAINPGMFKYLLFALSTTLKSYRVKIKLTSSFLFLLSITSTSAVSQQAATLPLMMNSFQSFPQSVQPNIFLKSFMESMSKATTDPSFRFRLQTQLPSSIALDNLSNGQLKMMWTQSVNFSSKEFAFMLLTSPPFIGVDRYIEWRSMPSTKTTVDNLYSKYGIKAIPCAAVDSNMDFVLRKVPEGENQYRGARIAMSGPYQELYAAIEIAPIAIPLGEVPRSLQTGTIDGAYTYSPYDSIEFRIYDSTKAIIHPSLVRSFFVIDLLFNQTYWEELQVSSREAVERTCRKLLADSAVTSRNLSLEAVEKYRKAGVTFMSLPQNETEVVRAKWEEIAAKRGTFEPPFAALYKSLYKN